MARSGFFASLRSGFMNHFLTGCFVLIPLAVIAWILTGVIGSLSEFYYLVPLDWPIQPAWIKSITTLGVTLTLLILVAVLGWVSKQVFGQRIFAWIKRILQKIPVVGTIYTTLDQLVGTLTTGKNGGQFRRVVLIEYPRTGVWAVAFVTGPLKSNALPPGYLNVFVPTVPNPTSGFHLMVHEKEVRESHMSVEEAFKMILSLGIAQPEKS